VSEKPPTEAGQAEAEQPSARSSWTPHLWALIVPIGFVVISYAFWFGFVWLFRFPDWLARLWRR